MSSTVGGLGRLTVFEMAPLRKGLGGGHHFDVAAVVEAAEAPGGLEGAIEDEEVLWLEAAMDDVAGCLVGDVLDGVVGIDVLDDGVDLGGGVAEVDEGGRDGLIDDLEHAAAG